MPSRPCVTPEFPDMPVSSSIDVRRIRGVYGLHVAPLVGLQILRTISTFSCDIAHAVSRSGHFLPP